MIDGKGIGIIWIVKDERQIDLLIVKPFIGIATAPKGRMLYSIAGIATAPKGRKLYRRGQA